MRSCGVEIVSTLISTIKRHKTQIGADGADMAGAGWMLMTFAAAEKGETMTDVDLIKALQYCADPWTEDRCPCEDCPIPKERVGTEEDMCDDYLMRLAADRLEELTK